MADLDRDEVWNNRAAQIRHFCVERGITKLLHFTRIENLRSILREGLLSRETLDSRGQQYCFNDQDRVDDYKNAVCLSISFPNYRMFYSIREEKKGEEVNDAYWTVLLLDAEVLWELDCAFCQENASSNRVRHIPLEDRKRPDALRDLFQKEFHNDTKVILRQSLAIPRYFPTNPQAEILMFYRIPPRYINKIVFWDSTTLRQWKSDNPTTYTQEFCADRNWFCGRSDSRFWKRDDFDSNDTSEAQEHQDLPEYSEPRINDDTNNSQLKILPVFVPYLMRFPYVKAIDLEVHWYSGQPQKSINSFHQAAKKNGVSPVLEISRESTSPLGVSLCAFNLTFRVPNGQTVSVECAFQGSKVFENGGPYHELYSVPPSEANNDSRLRYSGRLIAFNFFGKEYPIESKDEFYNRLYITALKQEGRHFARRLQKFEGFSDIGFNPQRANNCPARATALFVALCRIQWSDEFKL